MKILLDNGHGENTPGKRSPDGVFREYLYTREIAQEVERELRKRGYDCERIVRGAMDVSLAQRAKIVNEYCAEYGKNNVILISIHVNAAGNGEEWKNAKYWSCWTTKGKTKSDELATYLYEAAERNFTLPVSGDSSDGDIDKEEDFYILKNTKCPAVLTENFFMDNKECVSYLLSREGREAMIKTHIEGIMRYADKHL